MLVGVSQVVAGEVYEGAEKCKTCHSAAAKGEPYKVWAKQKHRQAYASLASDEAKKIGKEKGIDDPQKSEKCLKCHETAFGVPAAEKGKKFDETLGVQCETCHGAGGKHVAARLKEEDEEEGEPKLKDISAKGEITHLPGPDVCEKCHNKESPTYKPFDYVKFVKEIAHIDPRRKHAADWIDKLPEEVKKK
jgi:hypothetical protein